MSCQITYSRQVLQRVSDRKKRKLAVDDSDKNSSSDSSSRVTDSCLLVDSLINVIEDSQSSLKKHRDLFGELTPNPRSKDVAGKSISTKKQASKENEQPTEENLEPDNSVQRPPRVFIPTPQIIKLMKDTHTELYSLMGLNKSSSDISVVSNNSLNISGVQNLQDSPVRGLNNKSKITMLINENFTKSPPIFDGKFSIINSLCSLLYYVS